VLQPFETLCVVPLPTRRVATTTVCGIALVEWREIPCLNRQLTASASASLCTATVLITGDVGSKSLLSVLDRIAQSEGIERLIASSRLVFTVICFPK
jgi:hypothetical protein